MEDWTHALARQRRTVAKLLREAAGLLDAGEAGAEDVADTLAILERVYPFESSAQARERWRAAAGGGSEAALAWLSAWMRARAAEVEEDG